MDKIVFIDLETGGLCPHARVVGESVYPANPIIQIACVVMDCDTMAIVDEFEQKVKFNEHECDPKALQLNGYQRSVWDEHGIVKGPAREKLSEFLKKHSTVEKISKAGKPYKVAMLGGQNISNFDIPFLRSWYDQEFFPVDYHCIDTMTLAHLYSILIGCKFPSLSQRSLRSILKLSGTARRTMPWLTSRSRRRSTRL